LLFFANVHGGDRQKNSAETEILKRADARKELIYNAETEILKRADARKGLISLDVQKERSLAEAGTSLTPAHRFITYGYVSVFI
jgi:hypothetical protein